MENTKLLIHAKAIRELRLLLRALVEWKNMLLAVGKPTEDIDELLILLCK